MLELLIACQRIRHFTKRVDIQEFIEVSYKETQQYLGENAWEHK